MKLLKRLLIALHLIEDCPLPVWTLVMRKIVEEEKLHGEYR
jgi:hypothetical protein